MGAKRYTVALFALALVPSATLAWSWRDMAHLGVHHDDALYLVGAKSLAEGNGYRIESLPGQPFQTKYPPVLSALLAPLWKYGPGFPQNLPLLTLFAWMMLPAYLFFMRATFRHFGCGPKETWLLTFAAAVHPLVLLLGISIMSDLLFMTLFLACLLLAERALEPAEPAWLALAAGVLGGVAYLTRTSALPLALTAPLCFLLRRRYWRALLFSASMLPAVVGWQIWTSAHLLRTNDPVFLYYTNYMGMERATVHLDNLAGVVWHNFDGLLRGIAKLIVFDVIPTNPHLQQVIGVATIAGIVRLARRSRYVQYPAAAAGLAVLLLGYFFPPDERILLPVFPLVLLGFWTEARNLCLAVRGSWHKPAIADRAGAVVAGAAVAVMAGFVTVSYVLGDIDFLPKVHAACRDQRINHEPAYQWIRSHTAPSAAVYAYDDALLYLYTGRPALGLPAPVGWLYREDGDTLARQFALAVPQTAREHHLDYLMVTEEDFYREGIPGLVWKTAARDPQLEEEYAAAHAAVYGYRSRAGAVPSTIRTFTAAYPVRPRPAHRR
jgi:hypothetical protein